MPTIIDCPNCTRKLRVAADAATQVQCPTCGATFAPGTGLAEPAARGRCRFCSEDIGTAADFCPHCGEDVREGRLPWERPGAIRRDSLPHRGNLILGLGIGGLIAGSIPYFCWIGLPLGLAAWIMGRLDLGRMKTSVVDPSGRGTTQAGMVCGIIATLLSVLWLVGVALMIGLMVSGF